jgi:osmotically inducible protein OsmC
MQSPLISSSMPVYPGAPKVHFQTAGPGDFRLGVDLALHAPRLAEDQALAMMEKTHTVCPYSKATAGNIGVPFGVI